MQNKIIKDNSKIRNMSKYSSYNLILKFPINEGFTIPGLGIPAVFRGPSSQKRWRYNTDKLSGPKLPAWGKALKVVKVEDGNRYQGALKVIYHSK